MVLLVLGRGTHGVLQGTRGFYVVLAGYSRDTAGVLAGYTGYSLGSTLCPRGHWDI
jgi:hypothetical protein